MCGTYRKDEGEFKKKNEEDDKESNKKSNEVLCCIINIFIMAHLI